MSEVNNVFCEISSLFFIFVLSLGTFYNMESQTAAVL